MKTKEIGGVLYELVPEEKEESCKDCAFKDSDGAICTIFSKDCNEGLIYKKVDEPISTSNLKPFNLEAAKAGKPVCTRDGRKVRIVCFDRLDAKPILALVTSTDGKGEAVFDYFVSGKRTANSFESDLDLMMLPEKRRGWINIYKGGLLDTKSYSSKEEAVSKASQTDYIDTIKVEWEE